MKNKIIITIIVILITNPISMKAQQPPSFNAKEAAGVVNYDSDRVIKKLKIEDDAIKKAITKAIAEYNIQMYQLSDIYNSTFEELDDYFNKQVQLAMQRRDRSQMNGVKLKIKETIPPIRKEVMQHQNVLNDSMEPHLDEQQYEKWLKYQKNREPSAF